MLLCSTLLSRIQTSFALHMDIVVGRASSAPRLLAPVVRLVHGIAALLPQRQNNESSLSKTKERALPEWASTGTSTQNSLISGEAP